MFGNQQDRDMIFKVMYERMVKFYAITSVISSVTALLNLLLIKELHWGAAMGIMFGIYMNEIKDDKVNKVLSIVGIFISITVYVLYFLLK